MRCDCGPERWSDKPFRLALVDDIGERVLRDCEEATGERPVGCPWAALRDPFVGEVVRMHRHWKEGAVSIETLPASIVAGLETFDAALNSVQIHDMREDREERKREAEQRDLDRAAHNR